MTLATQTPIPISNQDFQTMLHFSRAIYKLKNQPEYIQSLGKNLPETTQIDSTQPSILMGYDFHLTQDKPKLIEINNNAGGLWEKDDGWIPQCNHPELKGTLAERIISMFPKQWYHIAIMDASITTQYMYPEMNAFAALLEKVGHKVSLVSPGQLENKGDGLYFDDLKVDAIYNRHTDFYLQSEAMQHIQLAFMQQQVVLNPYPKSYALIGDKNRMVDWWRAGMLENIVHRDTLNLIRSVVPETHLLSECEQDKVWENRKSWVFKPAARHGGKGVLLGRSMSKKRFATLETATTVMQKLVPPSLVEIDGVSFKFDVRLYMHGTHLIAMAGRAWNGQITNFREEGSGWTPIKVGN